MSHVNSHRFALPLASMLQEYRLDAVLGCGGYGITYLAWDTNLQKAVAIKEFLPVSLATRTEGGSVAGITEENQTQFEWGLERFILEARTLAQFSHANIVRVNRYFQAHATGYMVMDYEKGEALNQLLKRSQKLELARLWGIVTPLLDGLHAVHAAGFLHRDIKPQNIFVRETGAPVLLDFGAARQAMGRTTHALTSILTPGYAPLEQYSSDGQQGPWTDIYAMAGTLYCAMAGEPPPDAVKRTLDDTVPQVLGRMQSAYPETLIAALRWGLAMPVQARPQNVEQWRAALEGAAEAPQPAMTVTTVPDSPRRATPRGFSRWALLAALGAILVVVGASAGSLLHRAADAPLQKGRAEPEPLPPVAAAAPAQPPTAAAPEAPALPATPEPVAPSKDEPRPVAAPRPKKHPAMAVAREHKEPEHKEPERQEPEHKEPAPSPAAGASPPEPAAREPGYGMTRFIQADTNRDGKLTRDEVVGFPWFQREFSNMDVNNDGLVSVVEYRRFARARHHDPDDLRDDR